MSDPRRDVLHCNVIAFGVALVSLDISDEASIFFPLARLKVRHFLANHVKFHVWFKVSIKHIALKRGDNNVVYQQGFKFSFCIIIKLSRS